MSLRDPFKRGENWYCEVNRKRVSLKTKDKTEAMARFREIRKRYYEHLAGAPLVIEMTFGDFADEYEHWAEDAVESRKTLSANLLALHKLLAVVPRSLPLSALSKKHLDLLVAKNKGCKPVSINNYIRHASAVMNKAVDWNYLKTNPFHGYKKLKERKELPLFIPSEEIAVFLERITDIDERRLLTAYIFSGRRRSELWGLRWENINFEKEMYYISASTSKSNLSRWYPLHPTFKAVLVALGIKKKGRIFDKWQHPDSITHIAKAALVAGGYPELSLHKLRHTFATLLKDHGVDLDTIGALLGHTDRQATEIYAHITVRRQRSALSVIPCQNIPL